MKKYLEYKGQIQGFVNIALAVTSAEKIAATHIKKTQKALEDISAFIAESEHVFSQLQRFHTLKMPTTGRKLLLVVTGDKGLVGDLYAKVITSALGKQHEYDEVISLGAIGQKLLDTTTVIALNDALGMQNPLLLSVVESVETGKYEHVDILYAKPKSLTEQEVVSVRLLPLLVSSLDREEGLPLFEGSKREMVSYLSQSLSKARFQQYLLEAKLSEYSSRTVAMESAKAKTQTHIARLTILYFKSRLSLATQKQLESFTAHTLR